MAERLLKYYKYVGDKAGLPGKMQLARVTKIPSTQAAMEPDSPETLRRFREAVAQITGAPAPDL